MRRSGALGGPHPQPRGWAQPAPRGGVAASVTPSASLFAYKLPLDLNTKGGSMFSRKSSATPHHQIPQIRTRNSVLAPCRDGELEEIITVIITIASPSTIHVSPTYE